MKYKENWSETRQRFEAWWKGENDDRPLLRIVGRRKKPIEAIQIVRPPENLKDAYISPEYRVETLRNYCRNHCFLAEAYPSLDLNIGPGSLATYLGAEPNFSKDTVWYTECVGNGWREFGNLCYNSENIWFLQHVEAVKRGKELAEGDFLVNIPDLVENIDILSAMRGPQALCYDLMDEPELVRSYIHQIDELYFKYYDAFFNSVKGKEGGSSYTAFHIWGGGKTAKIQCDFSVFLSPQQFRDFILPSLQKQCSGLSYTLYHLDGPDAIKHLDAIMEIEGLKALQYTPGAGKPDAGDEQWYPVYDKVRSAGKSLWVMLNDHDPNKNVENAEKIIRRYGCRGIYLLFPDMDEEDAYKLFKKAEKEWH